MEIHQEGGIHILPSTLNIGYNREWAFVPRRKTITLPHYKEEKPLFSKSDLSKHDPHSAHKDEKRDTQIWDVLELDGNGGLLSFNPACSPNMYILPTPIQGCTPTDVLLPPSEHLLMNSSLKCTAEMTRVHVATVIWVRGIKTKTKQETTLDNQAQTVFLMSLCVATLACGGHGELTISIWEHFSGCSIILCITMNSYKMEGLFWIWDERNTPTGKKVLVYMDTGQWTEMVSDKYDLLFPAATCRMSLTHYSVRHNAIPVGAEFPHMMPKCERKLKSLGMSMDLITMPTT